MIAVPDGDLPTVHLRCGSDIFATLKEGGFTGACQEFSDPYCVGPLRAGADLPALRAPWLANAFDLPSAEVAGKLAAQYAALATIAPETRLVLWFEHDSYDQLILAYLLAQIAGTLRAAPTELICINSFPGIARFIGLGQLDADALRSLWPQRKPLTATHYAEGRQIWDALCAPDPRALASLMTRTTALPYMAQALQRHLQELPWVEDGLSLTQRLTLQALVDGPCPPVCLFGKVQAAEPLPFLGDLMFMALVRELTAGNSPAILMNACSGEARLSDYGRLLLKGEGDWMQAAPTSRWIGGVCVAPGVPGWRWSVEQAAPSMICY